MTPENLPTIENNIYNNRSESDWWFIEQFNELFDLKNNQSINSIKNSSLAKWWKLSLSTTILLLFVLFSLNYVYQNKETLISLFPTTSKYMVSTIQNTKILPQFFSSINNKFDLTAAMVYLKQISSKDEGNTIVINEGEKETLLEKPLRIKISQIGVDALVNNPINKDLDSLNKSLKSGAVRYPGSGLLGENKNVFIFGHSTSLETETTYYKIFNGLDKLQNGDEIIVDSSNNRYTYKVVSVKETNTADGAIRIDSRTQKLTISTCNTLGAKEDRFVVEAEFVKVVPLESSTPTTPTIGGNIVSPNPVTPTAGEEENRVYKNDPIVSPTINNPNGFVDLEAVIDGVGILNSDNNFVATTTFSHRDIGAIKFTVKNIGNKKSDGWTFNAVLPTSPAHIFHSTGQKILAPGEKIEFTMGFDKMKIGEQMPIIINVDPSQGMKESSKTNNIVKTFIDIIESE